MSREHVRPARARTTGAILLCALLCWPAAAQAQEAEPPDLLALSANGPGQAQLGQVMGINTFVVNLGGDFEGSYTFEVLLSPDVSIDPEDPIVATVATSVLGGHAVNAVVPAGLQPGTYNLALRVLPVAGETKTFNNVILGNQVILFDVDLCVADERAITASAVVDGPAPAPAAVEVSNCGTGGSILVFSIFAVPPAPWLTALPTASFAIAGSGSQPIQLHFSPAGLAPGAYATTVVLQNFSKPQDFVAIPVTFSVNETSFTPGDRLVGAIDGADDRDEALFPAVAGMRLKLEFLPPSGSLEPRLTVLDAGGATVKAFDLKHATKTLKKTVKLKQTGTYRLRVEGQDSSLGDYELRTASKLPKKASAVAKKLAPEAGLGAAKVFFPALGGTIVDVTLKPKGGFAGVLSIGLGPPGSAPFDLTPAAEPGGGGTLSIDGLLLPVLGDYAFIVGGFALPSDRVKLKLLLESAPKGGSIVELP